MWLLLASRRTQPTYCRTKLGGFSELHYKDRQGGLGTSSISDLEVLADSTTSLPTFVHSYRADVLEFTDGQNSIR